MNKNAKKIHKKIYVRNSNSRNKRQWNSSYPRVGNAQGIAVVMTGEIPLVSLSN